MAKWIPKEKVYSDPSAAHEWANRVDSMGWRAMISHDNRGFVVRWKERQKDDGEI